MDRYDEKKSGSDSSEMGIGDVLGLGGSTVPKGPEDPSASDDPESVRRRRERAMETDDAGRTESDQQHSGATGIDMGAAGQGTDVSGR
jgi:hypothetical protein